MPLRIPVSAEDLHFFLCRDSKTPWVPLQISLDHKTLRKKLQATLLVDHRLRRPKELLTYGPWTQEPDRR